MAKLICGKREVELIASDYDLTPAHKKDKDFIHYVSENSKTKIHTTALNYLKKFVGNEKLTFAQLTTKKLNEFADFALKDNLSPNSLNLYLVILKSFWNKAIKEKEVILKENPFDNFVKPKTTTPKIEYLDTTEIDLLLKTETNFNPQIRFAFLFSCFTGLRFSDIQALTWANIVDNHIEFRQKKSQKEAMKNPLPNIALQILEKIAPINKVATEKVFRELPTNNGYINDKLKIWAATAGIKKNLHFHVARHTFATLQISNETSVYVVSKLLGHSSVGMTQKYAKVIDSQKQQAMDKMNDFKL
jgi:integrase